MKSNDLFSWSDTRMYLIIMASMIAIIGFYSPILALIGILTFIYLIYNNIKVLEDKKKKFESYVENMSNDFDSAAKHAIFNMPFPLVIIDEKGTITWYNTPFLDMMVEEDILNERIYELVPGLNMDELIHREEDNPINIKYNDHHYQIYPNFIDTKKTAVPRDKIMLYWVQNTGFVSLQEHYISEKIIVALVYVDNYDDVRNATPDINRPMVLAEIDKRISAYFANYDGIVRKYENDKYLVVMDNWALGNIEARKFDLLDEIRELDIGNTIPITLSIGVSATGENPAKSYEIAKAAVDIGLGRGGNQAVLKRDKSFDFYGGKTKAVEKRNKVKARVIAYALRQLIDQADRVFVMGHKNPDMDSLGSGIGVLRAIENRDKEGYLVLDGENPSIKNIMDKMRLEQPELLERIISPDEATNIINKNSLMILVDNHKPSFTEAPELLDLVDKVVIIDHHRRGAEFVKDPVLTYLEPYASSASELVTEILSYMSDEQNLTKFEAEALMAGITVDTKNFSFQTGVRTFEAASILRRAGADTTIVRQLFRDDIDTFRLKAEVIKSSKLVFDIIAIGRLDIEIEEALLITAQSANELLNISGVEASFVLTYVNNKIHISGRSLGNISAQIILERLGGGGHLTSAGTQLAGVTMDEAERLLIDEIEKYIKDGGL